MALPNIFSGEVTVLVIDRINQLNKSTNPLWGSMSVAQMLAHCCITYEMVYDNEKHKKPNGITKFFLTLFVKKSVVGEKPYNKSIRTAPAFIIKEDKDFEIEKQRLINYIQKTQQLGGEYFNNKESLSFGNLSTTEWNNMFYKHLDHHLKQFGV